MVLLGFCGSTPWGGGGARAPTLSITPQGHILEDTPIIRSLPVPLDPHSVGECRPAARFLSLVETILSRTYMNIAHPVARGRAS